MSLNVSFFIFGECAGSDQILFKKSISGALTINIRRKLDWDEFIWRPLSQFHTDVLYFVRRISVLSPCALHRFHGTGDCLPKP